MKGFKGRPTTDFGREGLFNLLSSRVDLSGLHILDLFSGTGMVSLECLSRGAASVTAVEKAPKACRFAMAQAAQLGSDDLHTVCADVWTFLNKPLTQFDLVFADPPYDMPRLTSLPEVVRESGARGRATRAFHRDRRRCRRSKRRALGALLAPQRGCADEGGSKRQVSVLPFR